MTTLLDKALKRALRVRGKDYVVTLTPEGIKVTLKGHRIGVELKWPDLISGEAALAVALNASLGKLVTQAVPKKREPRRLAAKRARPK